MAGPPAPVRRCPGGAGAPGTCRQGTCSRPDIRACPRQSRACSRWSIGPMMSSSSPLRTWSEQAPESALLAQLLGRRLGRAPVRGRHLVPGGKQATPRLFVTQLAGPGNGLPRGTTWRCRECEFIRAPNRASGRTATYRCPGKRFLADEFSGTGQKRSFLLHADDEVIHRLAAIHQGDLHIGMELVFQGALGLFRLLLGDAFAVDQRDEGGVFAGKGSGSPARRRPRGLFRYIPACRSSSPECPRGGWCGRRTPNPGRQRSQGPCPRCPRPPAWPLGFPRRSGRGQRPAWRKAPGGWSGWG